MKRTRSDSSHYSSSASRAWLIGLSLLAGISCRHAAADTIANLDFEAPPYTLGAPLQTLADATGSWTTLSDASHFIVSNAQSRSGAQSIRYSGPLNSQLAQYNFTPEAQAAMDSQVVKLDFSIFRPVVDQRARIIALRQGGATPFEFGILGDADQILLSAGTETGGEAFIRSPAPSDINVWYDFSMLIDFSGTSTAQIHSATWSIAGGTPTEMLTAPVPFWYPTTKLAGIQLMTFNGPDPNLPNTSPNWAWDGIRITTIPEPSSLLIALGGVIGMTALTRRTAERKGQPPRRVRCITKS
jgi:hypothetical protein